MNLHYNHGDCISTIIFKILHFLRRICPDSNRVMFLVHYLFGDDFNENEYSHNHCMIRIE